MTAIGGVVKTLISPLGTALGLFKKPKAPAAALTPRRDDTLAAIGRDDELLRRRGGAADIVTGVDGAEAAAPASAKSLLGS